MLQLLEQKIKYLRNNVTVNLFNFLCTVKILMHPRQNNFLIRGIILDEPCESSIVFDGIKNYQRVLRQFISPK